jgi:hypothetical protein
MARTDDAPRFPTVLQHKHGLYDWSPMMPERSAETIVPGEPPTERTYRCQSVGCDAVVRLDADELRPTAGAREHSEG